MVRREKPLTFFSTSVSADTRVVVRRPVQKGSSGGRTEPPVADPRRVRVP